MKLQRATWPQVQEYFKKKDVVIIGTGSLENHGMHMPLGTDALVPEKLIDLVEQRCDILSTPVLPFGNCDYFTDFPGTISLGDEVLTGVLMKIAEGLYNAGARHFIYINGHGGNCAAIDNVCYAMSRKKTVSAVLNWWVMAGEMNPEWAGGHGGGEETAAIMYIDESLIDRSAMKPCDIKDVSCEIKAVSMKNAKFKGLTVTVPRDIHAVAQNGWYGPDDISKATPEWGDKMLNALADYIAEFAEEFQMAPLY